ncbi:hypothetical protein B0H63DRAFT_550522 [Podospora didyma]|uniref:O-methyltransferase C-terminal domain-containing protein n=1 Tax=Podospora didyma TaxID=330526 RepID=A0AAE0K9U0_9PEZI|nr:hypothetical protein B0H63DRAFT_550522 [Podospora didyma]
MDSIFPDLGAASSQMSDEERARHLEIADARIGEEHNLYKLLAGSEEPLTTAALAEKRALHPCCILRYLSSVKHITETDVDTFTANEVTKTLAQPGYRSGVYHFFNNVGPVMQALPDFLAETKYANIESGSKTAFQKAFNTTMAAPMWLSFKPEFNNVFHDYLSLHSAGMVPWFKAFPLEQELGNSSAELYKAALVDVSGDFGENLIEHQTMPPLHIQPTANQGREILEHLRDALAEGSEILIDDMVFPDKGVPMEASAYDLMMMAGLGLRERREAEWKALLDRVGLKVKEIYVYSPCRRDVIVQVVRK